MRAYVLTAPGAGSVQEVPVPEASPGEVVVDVERAGVCGDYAGGDSPGLSFTTADWLHGTEIAGIATDTWGFEVWPNEFDVAFLVAVAVAAAARLTRPVQSPEPV